MPTLSLDTETTGLDFHHGCRPFLVVTCEQETQEVTVWEWDVDPFTRAVLAPQEDLDQIKSYIDQADRLVLHNSKFDFQALRELGVSVPFGSNEFWEKVEDTLPASHVLASNQPKDLTSLGVRWLNHDISPYEHDLGVAVKKARSIIQQARTRVKNALKKEREPDPKDLELSRFKIAKKGEDGLPSNWGDDPWHADYWLPRAMALYLWSKSKAGQRWNLLMEAMESSRKKNPNIFRLLLARDKAIEECEKLDGWEWRPAGLFPRKNSSTFGEEDQGHPWYTVLNTYARADAEITAMIWPMIERTLRQRKTWPHYRSRLQAMRLAYKMEEKGVTLVGQRHAELKKEFSEASAELANKMVNIAATYEVDCLDPNHDKDNCKTCSGSGFTSYELNLPKGAVNNSLRTFCFDVMKLPHVVNPKASTTNPSLDSKNAIPFYLDTLAPKSKPLRFIQCLRDKRARDTAVGYLEAYERFWLPTGGVDRYRLHPSLNPCGSDTLRWTSQNPNEQNIGKNLISIVCKRCLGLGPPDCSCKGTGEDGANVRLTFGPDIGREWWSFDAKNIERRIPDFESKEPEMIALYERENEPPFYGSFHMLIFSVIWPELWEAALKEVGPEKVAGYCKKKYADGPYQWTKNGNFAVQYGAVDKTNGKGTADRAYHKPGAQRMIKSRFTKLEALNRYWINFANQHGYVETMPDRTIDPHHGYPLMVTMTERSRVLETVPLSYHVQGTAMHWTHKAMIRVDECLEQWNREVERKGKSLQTHGYWITLQVHDELVPDFPKMADPRTNRRGSNYWRAQEIKRLMALGGEDIGVPTPVGCEYHPVSWGEGISV